jgi:hypothetical protein
MFSCLQCPFTAPLPSTTYIHFSCSSITAHSLVFSGMLMELDFSLNTLYIRLPRKPRHHQTTLVFPHYLHPFVHFTSAHATITEWVVKAQRSVNFSSIVDRSLLGSDAVQSCTLILRFLLIAGNHLQDCAVCQCTRHQSTPSPSREPQIFASFYTIYLT